jgi:large subunit ribosomal protein L10
MAAEKPRPEKVAVVDEVRARMTSASAALLTEYRGLKVHELAQLRGAIRQAGGEYKIYKNTLVRLAVADLGLPHLEELLVGPTAIAFVDGDAVLVAKSLRDFARTNPNLLIKGGVLGTSVLSAADASALAEVAPRDQLLAQFAGLLAAPLRQFAGLLAAVPRNFAYGLSALIDKKGGPEAATGGTAGGADAATNETAGGADAATSETPSTTDTATAAGPPESPPDASASEPS